MSIRKLHRWTLAALTSCVLLGLAPAAVAQSSSPQGSLEAATYKGADRQQRLIAGAKKEGTLLLYTSAPPDDVAILTDTFEKKYGVKVRVWRASAENVLNRTVTEARGNRFEVDIIDTNGPEMESLHREKLLQAVNSPYLVDLIPQAIQPHREWVGTRLNIFAFGYNPNLVKKADLPKSYEDLLDPKWKGKLGVDATDDDWFSAVVGVLGEARGLKLFREIVAKNGISVRKGHTLLTNLVISGEVPMALTVYNYKAEQLKNKGAPIDWFVFSPAIARSNGAGVLRHAPHPNAAVLYYDFMLSDAQTILLKRDFVPTSKKADTKLNRMPIKFIDSAVILDENDKWNKLFDEIFVKQAK